MRKIQIQYIFTDNKGGFYSVIKTDTDRGENIAYNKAKTELSKYNGELPSPCRLYQIVDL